MPQQEEDGRPVALITGATDGLGRALAAALADHGATVLVHGRDRGRVADTVRELSRPGRAGRIRGYVADFAELGQVADLARQIEEGEPRLDVLVNNAGIGALLPDQPGRVESRDGVELRFAVNYLAPFLLSHRLLPLLVRSRPARIVNVSSTAQRAFRIDFDDLELRTDFDPGRAYCQSKLAQIMFTIDLADQVAADGVIVNALHPATFMPTKMVATPVSTLQEGVEATLRLVVGPDIAGITGCYFEDGRPVRPNEQALDPDCRARLRARSHRLLPAALRLSE